MDGRSRRLACGHASARSVERLAELYRQESCFSLNQTKAVLPESCWLPFFFLAFHMLYFACGANCALWDVTLRRWMPSTRRIRLGLSNVTSIPVGQTPSASVQRKSSLLKWAPLEYIPVGSCRTVTPLDCPFALSLGTCRSLACFLIMVIPYDLPALVIVSQLPIMFLHAQSAPTFCM